MHNPEVRAKMTSTLRAMGWKPPTRGGNGKGPTGPQSLLADLLGWPMEVAVPTKMPRGSGYPSSYKLDIAELDLMVGIEVDGFSHCALARQRQDAKKEELLASLGWTVLRFTNREVMEDLRGCVQTVLSTIWRSTGITTSSQTAS